MFTHVSVIYHVYVDVRFPLYKVACLHNLGEVEA